MNSCETYIKHLERLVLAECSTYREVNGTRNMEKTKCIINSGSKSSNYKEKDLRRNKKLIVIDFIDFVSSMILRLYPTLNT